MPIDVAIVEDDSPTREGLGLIINSTPGYACVGTFDSVEAALRMPADAMPDVLLLDIHLPTMSGLALYLAIIHRWPALEGHIAIMTGDAEAEEVRTWLNHHHCTVIRKPFNLQQVADWVSSALQRDRTSGAMDA